MLTTTKLTSQAEEQRAQLEEKLLTAQFDVDENGNRKYKNLGVHVVPLLQSLELQIYYVYAFKDIFDNQASGLVIHHMAFFLSNNHQQRNRISVPNTTKYYIGNTTN